MGGCCAGKYEYLKSNADGFFELKAKDIDGNDFSFNELKNVDNKAFLIVNVASN